MAIREGRYSLPPSGRNFYQQLKRRKKDLCAKASTYRFSEVPPKQREKESKHLLHLAAETVSTSTTHPTPPKAPTADAQFHARLGPARKALCLKSASKSNSSTARGSVGQSRVPARNLLSHPWQGIGCTNRDHMGMLHRLRKPERNHLGGCLTPAHSLGLA